MSEVRIVYSSLEEVVDYASKIESEIDNYVTNIRDVIKKPINSLDGKDTEGYVQSAASLAEKKISELKNKKTYFKNLTTSLNSVMKTAKRVDSDVANKISEIAEKNSKERKWYEAVGDWIYDTFCVDLANHFPLVRDFIDTVKHLNDIVFNVIDNLLDDIYDWFKYGDGKYIWQIGEAIVGVVVSIAGAVIAFAAIPLTAGGSVPYVVACIGAVASSIGALITVVDSRAQISGNVKALSLSGDIRNDSDGDPGAARYYGSISKQSEEFEKKDYGNQSTNAWLEIGGKAIDLTKCAADSTALACSFVSLGNKLDHRVTTRPNPVNMKHNAGLRTQGYEFTWKNIKNNIMFDMGKRISSTGFKKGSFGLHLVTKDSVKMYTISTKKFKYVPPKQLVKVFNYANTADNTMALGKGLEGLYDFYKEPDKEIGDSLKVIESIGGIGKTSKVLSPINKYFTGRTGTKNTLEEVDGLVGE